MSVSWRRFTKLTTKLVTDLSDVTYITCIVGDVWLSLRVRLLESNREFLPLPPPLEKMEEGKKIPSSVIKIQEQRLIVPNWYQMSIYFLKSEG